MNGISFQDPGHKALKKAAVSCKESNSLVLNLVKSKEVKVSCNDTKIRILPWLELSK